MQQACEFFQTSAANDGVTPSGVYLDGSSASSSSASFVTAPMFVGRVSSLIAMFLGAGAAVGTVKLQICLDLSTTGQGTTPDAALVNWIDVPFVDPTTGAAAVDQTVTGAVPVVFDRPFCTERWVRLNYTRTSGTAVFTARAQVKESST